MAEHSGVTAAVAVSAVFVSYKQALCAHKAMPMNGLGGRMVVFQAVFQGAGLWPGWNRVLARFGLILEQGLPVVCPDLGIGFGGNCVLVWNTAGRQAYPQRVDGCRRGAGAWPGCAQAAVQAGGRRGRRRGRRLGGTRKGQGHRTPLPPLLRHVLSASSWPPSARWRRLGARSGTDRKIGTGARTHAATTVRAASMVGCR